MNCPICNSEMRYYDRVKRIIRYGGGRKEIIFVNRYKCDECNKVIRKIPGGVVSQKQYHSEIIFGVLAGTITSDTLGYEDYPCEMTMNRWCAEFTHSVMVRP